MDYISIQEASEIWGITKRRVSYLCQQGRFAGARKFGNAWALPAGTEKPADLRVKSGKYKKDILLK